jgi:serine/threonine protein phosphatase 1
LIDPATLKRGAVPATPEPPDPVVWRERVAGDLAGVAEAFGPRRHGVQLHRFRSSAEPLKPVTPREAGARRPGAWPLVAAGGAGQVIYAVGDVHGRYDLLKDLLAQIAADRAAGPEREPVLLFLGDYIDRGPESGLVLEAMVQLAARDPAGVCLLKGNHEQGLLEFLDAPDRGGPWLSYGGRETLASYGVGAPDEADPASLRQARDALLAAMPASHLRLLQTLEAMAVSGGYVFAHAGVAPGRPLTAQREADLLWIRKDFLDASRPCAKVVVHGHTWRSADPELLDGRIGVDTGAYETGVLTAVRLEGSDRRVLQARDPDARWAPPEPPPPQLISSPQDFRQLGWSVELSFSPPAEEPLRLHAPQPRERETVRWP